MIILAMDTTAITASVALLDDECPIASFDIHNKLTHSEKLLPMIDSVLVNSGYTIDDVELVAVSEGPGSFTGVRIGVATAKGIAFPKNLPVVGVSAIEAMAESFAFSTSPDLESVILSPSMDARRNELYNALFEYDGRSLKRLTDDRPISCEELEAELITYGKRVIINGDGAEKLHCYLRDNSKVVSELAPQLLLKQSAVSVGRLAYRLFKLGKYKNVSEIAPLYLRSSQAERMNNKENLK